MRELPQVKENKKHLVGNENPAGSTPEQCQRIEQTEKSSEPTCTTQEQCERMLKGLLMEPRKARNGEAFGGWSPKL